jgi:hypothetical protein
MSREDMEVIDLGVSLPARGEDAGCGCAGTTDAVTEPLTSATAVLASKMRVQWMRAARLAHSAELDDTPENQLEAKIYLAEWKISNDCKQFPAIATIKRKSSNCQGTEYVTLDETRLAELFRLESPSSTPPARCLAYTLRAFSR